MPGMSRLPVDAHIPQLRAHLARHRAAVLVAAPGAGKTTRVPPALAGDGPVIVLQPRRAAARALARRVADEQRWTLGREVGWHVRFEPRFGPDTRVLFATEGILTARLQQDPLLEAFTTVVIDEFHERSVHADLGLALVRQAWLARDDMRVLVMSATIDADPVSRFLGDCPVIDVAGSPHPLAVSYAPDERLPTVVDRCLRDAPGNVLCFLAGAREIDEAGRALAGIARTHAVDVLPLHGALPADAQDLALGEATRRRVVLATNIAETSVTVPGVRIVVDGGLQKVARYDAARGVDALRTERITADAAAQRAGRAARLGPGLAVRLWSERDTLRPFREPDIARVDLAPVLLAVLAWGGDVAGFEWFEAPPADRIGNAMTLLTRLGAFDGTVTSLGRHLARLPLPPRLARIVVEAGGHPDACLAAAMLSERRLPTIDGRTTTSDVLSLLPAAASLPHVRAAAAAIGRSYRSLPDQRTAGTATPERASRLDEAHLRRALLAGYPDRVAQRRTAHGDSLLLAAGTGARQGTESGVRDAEFVVALEVRAVAGREPVVPIASAVDREWLVPTHTTRTVRVDERGRLRAAVAERYDALLLREQPDALRPDDRAVLADAWRRAARRDEDVALLRRLAFAGAAVDVDSLLASAVADASSLDGIDLVSGMPWDVRRRLATDAPERLALPSGRTATLEYDEDGTVRAAVKLQELFGFADTPVVGPRRVPVLFELLAPSGRPVQTTRDLRSFWTTTYAEVRKELRARYPRHPWPEDPWTATPTHRTVTRRGGGRST